MQGESTGEADLFFISGGFIGIYQRNGEDPNYCFPWKNEDPGITAGERTASGEKDPSEEKSGVEQITGEMNDEYKL